MGKPPGDPSLDLPDPLGDAPQLDLGNADELIAQLAGDDLNRLMHSDEDLAPVTDDELELTPTERPAVEELTRQLDDVFDAIEKRAPEPPPVRIDLSTPAPITLPEPVLAMRRFEEAESRAAMETREMEHRRSLLDPIEDPPGRIVRWLAWLNAPVGQLTRGPRFVVSAVSLLSFFGSVAALVYVLMLRRSI